MNEQKERYAEKILSALQRRHLLLIENDPANARRICEALHESGFESEGFDLQWVDRLQSGLEHVSGTRTDLVLLNLSLPDAQGLSTMKRFQSQAPDVPIVILTDTADDAVAIEALQLGAQDCIRKDDFQERLFGRSIRYALERALERKRFESQITQTQKMDALGRLAGGVAHDFNNLLTVILGHAELQLTELHIDSPARRHTMTIITAADRAASLTRQLLAFSRKGANRPEILNIGKTVGELGKMLRRVIPERIEMTVNSAPALGLIKADPTHIEQVVMNLVINARDAMPNGGKLLIEASNITITETDPEWHDPIAPGHYVSLTVTDNGVGMDEESRHKIFEPFFTSKPPGEGTGLGLAMVYGIVAQSGGQIRVCSKPGLGTMFMVYFPRVLDSTAPLPPAADAQPIRKGIETILLVEDEKNLRTLVESFLTGWGYNVLIAADGEEALTICREIEGRVDLVITDMVMPNISGVELVRQIRRLRPETPYIYMSGYPAEMAGHNIAIDPDFYIQKPFSPSQLSRMLEQVFENSRR